MRNVVTNKYLRKVWMASGALCQRLPLLLPAMLAGFSLVAMILLLGGMVNNLLLWPLGVVAGVAAVVVVWQSPEIARPGSKREQRIVDVIAVAGMLIWGLSNVFFASQHVFTNRDPGTYANAAAWLVQHQSLTIATPSIFGETEGLKTSSPGFTQIKQEAHTVQAQGEHLLPVLLGAAGRLVGQENMLRLPPLIGAVALLAFYGLARLIVRPRFALAAMVAVGASLPMLYFSRDTYTEPLTMVFVFGGLALLQSAFSLRQRSLWVLAGLVVGTGALVRIDTFLILSGLVLSVAVFLMTRQKSERSEMLRQAGYFGAGVALPALVSVLDLRWLSTSYYHLHKVYIFQEIVLLAGAIVLGLFLVYMARQKKWLTNIEKQTRAWRAPVAALLVIIIGLFLAGRPLWQEAHFARQPEYIAQIQIREGDPVSPRLYTEQSVQWVSWYIGSVMITLGLAGVAIGAAKGMRKDGIYILPLVLVVSITALIYFLKPSVAPDQIWAARRFLPVVLPGLVIFGMYVVDILSKKFADQYKFGWLFVGTALVELVMTPVMVSRPFLRVRDTAQLPVVSGLCQKLPKNAAVLWLGDGQYYTMQATRSFCGVPAVSYASPHISQNTLKEAARHARQAGYKPVVAVLSGDATLLGKQQTSLSVVSDHSFNEMETRLQSPPRHFVVKKEGVLAGALQPNGQLKPL